MDRKAVVIGAGPAGLMAAEVLGAAGVAVTVYERMPSAGRKFLMAGRGGLNLTHSEPLPRFMERYGPTAARLAPYVEAFPPAALTAWAEGLGQETFVGSSGRIFPRSLKASPLLRAWLARLSAQGVEVRNRHEWLGWSTDGVLLRDAAGLETSAPADVVVLALGGASWPRLGSDGAWASVLAKNGVEVSPFKPANCGFTVAWSDLFRERFQGHPLKNVAVTFQSQRVRGDAMITRHGLEGGPIYGLAASLRDALASGAEATIYVDLRPEITAGKLTARLTAAKDGQSLANRLRKTFNMTQAEINLLREPRNGELPTSPAGLATLIKGVPIRLTGVQPLARAISTAGGVALDAVDENLMLRARPGVFIAGEMLDWEAPTGGYLLQATFATGRAAGQAALAWLARS